MKIILKSNLQNSSLQVRDKAWKSVPDANGFGSEKVLIGEITEVGINYIKIDSPLTSVDPDDFIMFNKDNKVNKNSLVGYYAEVKLENNSSSKAELFSIGSEVTESSK
mgnify:CR=1 FL=1|tara:strand:- start:2230 stop:2553 length:324 start_codon:yes stop_codon:yes gene_type:complete